MNKHTATPWIIDENGATTIECQAQQLLEHANTPDEWVCIGIDDEEGFAEVVCITHPSNAEFIVRAVNSHDELVYSLDMAIGILDDIIFGAGIIGGERESLETLRKALRKAKGE